MKKTLFFIGILVLVVVFIGYSGFFNKESNSEDSQVLSSGRYINNDHGFSFEQTSTTQIEAVYLENGETLVVKSDLGTFQIYITPFDEEDTLITKERIIKDVPGINISEHQDIAIGKTARGSAFTSKDGSIETAEVWFVFNSTLYQVSSPLESRNFLVDTLATWEWVE